MENEKGIDDDILNSNYMAWIGGQVCGLISSSLTFTFTFR